MPITQTDLQAIEDALGTGPQSGQSSPNGHNVQGALNVITRTAQDMQEYGVSLSDLPDEKATEYRAAVEDLRHYREMLAKEFAEELAGSLDGIELPDGSIMEFPGQP
jgi:hypothetical protein